jgi:hypothetical protein
MGNPGGKQEVEQEKKEKNVRKKKNWEMETISKEKIRKWEQKTK